MNAEMNIGEIRNIGTQHDERAVQNVDDVEHAPYQGEADRDACVQPAKHEAIRSDLQVDHGRPSIPPDSPTRRESLAIRMPKLLRHEADLASLDGVGPEDNRLAADQLKYRRLQ